MKKLFVVLSLAVLFATEAGAQIVSSTSKEIVPEVTVEKVDGGRRYIQHLGFYGTFNAGRFLFRQTAMMRHQGLIFFSNLANFSFNCLISSSFSLFTECLNLNMARFSSKEVSLLCLGSTSDMISSTSCPPRCKRTCCSVLLSSCCGTSTIILESSFNLAYASAMAIVVSTAFYRFRAFQDSGQHV